jgi:hypothetical protein
MSETSVLQKRAAGIKTQWDERRVYIHTDQTDRVVREAYHLWSDFSNKKALSNAAQKLGWPKHAIAQRGKALGLTRTKEKPWSDPEEQLLENYGFLSLPRIAKKLREAGFTRSETAIHLKAKRLRVKATLDGWCMRGLAEAFGVDGTKVARWTGLGILRSRETGITVGRNEKTFYHRDDVRRFMLNHPEEWDPAKCEKYWLIDLLSDGKLCEQFRREVA